MTISIITSLILVSIFFISESIRRGKKIEQLKKDWELCRELKNSK